MTVDHSEAFDCCECGRHIVRIVAQPHVPHLCAACIHMPGWFRMPEIRDLLDPTHDGQEASLP